MGASMKRSRKRKGRMSNKSVSKRTQHMRMKRRSSKHAKRTRRHRKHTQRHVQRGGWNLGNIISTLPFGQDITNIGRAAGTGISNMYRGIKGVHKGYGQYPTQNQLVRSSGGKSGSMTNRKPMDMASIYKKNKQMVKGI